MTSFLCRQDGLLLSYHSGKDGYNYISAIAGFIHSNFGNRETFSTKLIRNNNCDVILDSYGDRNVVLCLFGNILKYMEQENEKLPSKENLSIEIRACSYQKLDIFSEEEIYDPIDENEINTDNTIFDKEFWIDTPKSKLLFEETIDKIIKENNPDNKKKFKFRI